MATFDTWESYFYPDTYDPATGRGTLRNLEGLRDPHELARFEYRQTAFREQQLTADPSLVEHTYDAAHLRAIHQHLFQDVYRWAGSYRTVNLFKGTPRGFADIGDIDRYLADAHQLITTTDWAALDRDEFAGQAATVFAYINQAHPHREENGRAAKVFMHHVAAQSRFALNYNRVDPQAWNQASMLSGPDLGAYEPVPDSLVPGFRHLAVDRPHGPEQRIKR